LLNNALVHFLKLCVQEEFFVLVAASGYKARPLGIAEQTTPQQSGGT
jgi:hypothetical protein